MRSLRLRLRTAILAIVVLACLLWCATTRLRLCPNCRAQRVSLRCSTAAAALNAGWLTERGPKADRCRHPLETTASAWYKTQSLERWVGRT